MNLLVVMQRVDARDENLGAFYVWLKEFATHASKVVAIGISTGDYSDLPPNVAVYSMGKESGAGRLRRLWKYWELFSRHYARSDAVFFQMSPEFVLVAAPFLLSRPRTSALWYSHKNPPGIKAKLAEKLVDYIFTPTALNFRHPSKKLIETGHAIDLEAFCAAKPPQGSGLRLLAVGRISPVKEYETMIQACAILKESWPHSFVLSIVGAPLMSRDHAYFGSLKRFIREKRLEGVVVFEGPRPYTEMPSIYHNHDIFISMTATGSFDKTIVEAMACGLGVITANRAFRKFLPPRYFLEHANPQFLSERIKALAHEPRPNSELRRIAATHHGLAHTIQKMVSLLSSPV